MTANERITLGISALALALAGFSVYHDYFYVKEEAKLILVGWKAKGTELSADVAILNTGTVQVLITAAQPRLMGIEDKKMSASLKSALAQSELPVLIKPGAIEVLRLRGVVDASWPPLSDARFSGPNTVDNPAPPGSCRAVLGVKCEGVTSSGAELSVSDWLFDFGYDKNGVFSSRTNGVMPVTFRRRELLGNK